MPDFRFHDARGVACVVRIGDEAQKTIWVGCEKAELPKPFVNPQVQLNKEIVADLIPVLQDFAETTDPSANFDYAQGETTVLLPQPRKGLSPFKAINQQPAFSTDLESIPVLEKAKAINDTQQVIDRLKINRLQKAFVYLLGKVSGFYTGNWTTSEAITSAVIKFGLSKREARRLRKIYGISRSSGTPR